MTIQQPDIKEIDEETIHEALQGQGQVVYSSFQGKAYLFDKGLWFDVPVRLFRGLRKDLFIAKKKKHGYGIISGPCKVYLLGPKKEWDID